MNNQHTPSSHLATAHASDSCLMLDYVRVINFLIISIIIITVVDTIKQEEAAAEKKYFDRLIHDGMLQWMH